MHSIQNMNRNRPINKALHIIKENKTANDTSLFSYVTKKTFLVLNFLGNLIVLCIIASVIKSPCCQSKTIALHCALLMRCSPQCKN